MAGKIQDFGEKIGGAKKDLWSNTTLMLSNFETLTDVERNKYCTKDYVWPRPDWAKLHSNGADQTVLYWQSEMRKAFQAKPLIVSAKREDKEEIRKAQAAYVKVCSEFRDAVMAVKTESEITSFYKGFMLGQGYVTEQTHNYGGYHISVSQEPKMAHCMNNRLLKLATPDRYAMQYMKQAAKDQLFAIPKERKVYERVKLNLIVAELDGKNCKAEPDDRYGGTKVVLGSPMSKLFFYDHGTENLSQDDYKIGTFLVLNRMNGSVTQNGIPTREIAEKLVEAAAVKMQEKENEVTKTPSKESNRKKNFALKQLDKVERTGPNYLNGRHAAAKNFLDDLGFRGGEFGNWLASDTERQTNLDMAYQSFRDLAHVLHIEPRDVSLGGQLAIAFGARGRGGSQAAAAHYEPDRTVIALTRMKGSGCTAHEFGHAIDDYLGKTLDLPAGVMLSEAIGQRQYKEQLAKAPKAMAEIVELMHFKQTSMTEAEAMAAKDKAVELSKKSLDRWLDSVKPRNMTPEQTQQWEKLCNDFITKRDDLVGGEYFSFRGNGYRTYGPMEAMSDFHKQVTGHVISKQQKFDFANFLHQYKNTVDRPLSEYMKTRTVESDYHKGSRAFDGEFAKSGQGYWSSTCEEFARAFDCFVEDKLKAEGIKSQYLTAHASHFAHTMPSGEVVRAYPVGKEREALNQKFEELIDQVKEMGLFHEETIDQQMEQPETKKELTRDEMIDRDLSDAFSYANSEPVQLSFGDFMH